VSRRRRAVLTTLLVGLALPARARDAPGPPRVDVDVVAPAADDAVLVEAAARTRLELGASGLASALIDGAGDGGAPARVAFVRDGGVATIDVVGTRPDATSAHRRVAVPAPEGGDDGAVLALRAVELLRGIRLAERRDATAPPRAPAAELLSVEAPAVAIAAWRLAVGPSLLEGRPWGASVAPGVALQAEAVLTPQVSFVVAGAGPFYNDLPPTPDGSAHTREELALFGLGVHVGGPRFAARAVVGAGVHHLVATYDARGAPAMPPPTELHVVSTQSLWTPFLAVGAGVSRRLSHRLGASLEVVAIVAQPAVAVVVNGHTIGTSGEPSLLESLTAWMTFP
jgi:hypothetical protein